MPLKPQYLPGFLRARPRVVGANCLCLECALTGERGVGVMLDGLSLRIRQQMDKIRAYRGRRKKAPQQADEPPWAYPSGPVSSQRRRTTNAQAGQDPLWPEFQPAPGVN